MLMPTSRPTAQAAAPGSPAKIITASTRSTTPLASSQPQRGVLRWLLAYMIEAMPSTTKKAISTNVSETAPVTGRASSMPPTRMASAADTSDHQKPGAARIIHVV